MEAQSWQQFLSNSLQFIYWGKIYFKNNNYYIYLCVCIYTHIYTHSYHSVHMEVRDSLWGFSPFSMWVPWNQTRASKFSHWDISPGQSRGFLNLGLPGIPCLFLLSVRVTRSHQALSGFSWVMGIKTAPHACCSLFTQQTISPANSKTLESKLSLKPGHQRYASPDLV